MLLEPEMDGLLRAVLARIDDPAALNAQQQRAFTAAEHAFDWGERGRALCDAIVAQRGRALRKSVTQAASYGPMNKAAGTGKA